MAHGFVRDIEYRLAPESKTLRYYSGKISRFLLRDRTLGYLFLAPALLVILVLVIYPSWVPSFSRSSRKRPAPGTWVGLNNYRELLSNEVFSRTVYNSIFYTVVAVALKFVFGLSMALVLNQERLFNNFFRSFLLIPWAIPTVISALNWRWIYDDASGLINNVLVRLELIDETISWLSDPNLAMGAVIAVVVWQGTPFFTMGFLAGLQSISKELYEAAEIDGASVLQQFQAHHHPLPVADHHHRGHAVHDLDRGGHPVRAHLDQRRPGGSHHDFSDVVLCLRLGGRPAVGDGGDGVAVLFPRLRDLDLLLDATDATGEGVVNPWL